MTSEKKTPPDAVTVDGGNMEVEHLCERPDQTSKGPAHSRQANSLVIIITPAAPGTFDAPCEGQLLCNSRTWQYCSGRGGPDRTR